MSQLESLIPIFSIDSTVWDEGKRLAKLARAAALTVPTADILVAACAYVHDVGIEHHGDEHFSHLSTLI